MGKYTLVITEKPDAAQRIASALDLNQKAKRLTDHRVPFYVAQRDREIVVVPALGHLYTVAAEKSGRDYYPVFAFKWVPRHVAEKGTERIRVWLEVISKLAEDADTFIDACDYDIEGSIIGYNILKYACQNKEHVAKRMKYSTLTRQELEKSYDEPLPQLDFALIEAGLARHEVDWLYGINLTRALTITAKHWSGQYTTLSTGRVQGPTLKFLAVREKTIKTFVPTPYWQVKAHIDIDGQTLEAQYEKEKIETRKEAEAILNACKRSDGKVEKIEVRQFLQPPPLPFDLGALQNEAYRLFGYTPRRTAHIAQQLYLNALISYPRTSSQKLPSAIGYENIRRNLSRSSQYKAIATELLAKPQLKPNEGKREDPAHPAVYSTGNLPERSLDTSERRIWNLVVRRFMAAFGEPATKQDMKVHINVNGHCFHLQGSQTLREGWIRFYAPYAKCEKTTLPSMKEDQSVVVSDVNIEDKFTRPPARYNPASLLRKMEQQEIGTKATRADVIQTLYDRNYVQDEKIAVTDLGFEVLDVLEKHCPSVVSIGLTRELEERMEKIRTGNEKRENVLTETVEILKPVLAKVKENEKTIGEQLSNAVRNAKAEKRVVGACPVCETGKLMILYSRKTGKRFVGCGNFFKGLCKASAPLPQQGAVKPLGRGCHACSWPLVQVTMKGKRPWRLCLNPECPLKKEPRKK